VGKLGITCCFTLGVFMKIFLLASSFLSLISSLGVAAQTSMTATVTASTDFVITSKQISTGNRFQAISIDEKGGLWVSGTNSSVYHSADLGQSWSAVKTPDTGKDLQFRDIQVVDNKIILMSAGEGADSRLYMSDDKGESWSLTNQGQTPETFYDCFSMLNSTTGWLYGDSADKQFSILKTTDGAKTWKPITMPFKAQADEGGFASSGTCLNHNKQGDIAIGTGNAENPRLLIKKKDQAWQSITSPYKGGEAAGIFSVQFDKDNLYTFGGSLKTKGVATPVYKYSLSTSSWHSLLGAPLTGAVYGSAITKEHVFITNPEGIAVLNKNKTAWRKLSDLDIWAMACKDNNCWGVGANGTVVTIAW